MLTFLLRRTLLGLGVLIASSFVSYIMVDFAIDPLEDLRVSNDPDAAAQIADRIRLLNLDAHPVERYLNWAGNFVTGDLGNAWTTGRPVSAMLSGAVISTIQLVTASTFLAIIFGVGIGIILALRQYSAFDYIFTFIAFVLFSLPSFWVAVLLKQWGAIGFNNFLRDPHFSLTTIATVGAVFGLMTMLAVGGPPLKRLGVFAIAFAATAGALFYLQWSGWWSSPGIGPELLAVTGLGFAFIVTILSTGLKHRRSLFTALTVVAIAIAIYYPMQNVFRQLTRSELIGWPLLFAMGLIAIIVGVLVGVAWWGPDWKQSARTGGIVAFIMAGLIFVDRVLQVWVPYFNAPAVAGRPIPTFGDARPGLGGNFWVQTLDQFNHLVLPTIVLVLISFAFYTRFSRGSMLEVLNQDYIRTARAKGLPERTVIMRHGFRNSLIPLATLVPVDIITMIGGVLITEQIFNRPGMGLLFLRHLQMNDINPVMAYLVIVASLAIIANIVADLMYAALDPRIRVNA